ncbi:MAG: hypothetical protein JOZ16_03505 [Methylobacteriaceae bacterium]|nr:hypothetical protein [Methylobacteriaceae bacterium]
MSDAVIVSTARSPVGKAFRRGKAYRGKLNDTGGPVLAARAIRSAAGPFEIN